MTVWDVYNKMYKKNTKKVLIMDGNKKVKIKFQDSWTHEVDHIEEGITRDIIVLKAKMKRGVLVVS